MAKIGSVFITYQGIEFDHHGDDVVLLWPWRWRKAGGRFMSFGFDGVFNSLKEIDEMWEEYDKAICRNL